MKDERTAAVQRMQDHIERHLYERITMADLASAALFSPWYSYRLFRELTGLTPAAYARRLRLSRSAVELKRGDRTITDVAFAYGFGSVDGYVRAFFREFGRTPGDFARSPTPIMLFHPYGVQYQQPRKEPIDMDTMQYVCVTPIHKPRRKAIIKRGRTAADYWAYCEEVGCDVWGTLLSMDSLCGEPVCLWLPAAYRAPGTSTYVQGVEVGIYYDGPVPEGFDVIELPEADYLMFQGQPFAERDFGQAIQFVQGAADRYDPAVLGYEWSTRSPRIQLEPKGERGYIEFRPVQVHSQAMPSPSRSSLEL
ncbi:transcriptional regulator [Bifidobacterium pseudolongum subsp. globosum]|uniref:Transcriptional regulator n=1 Tax=Bifidobacterium pseudolongum subsp. globosum TaxID=1690 RepID=A0A2N3QLS6_9BIFI|nr:AraC family transcriptional regulator [Bifidobacterium pseudolongum]PKU92635.1 transcriptional regulator [Bifidobacterium pseudolongum subsp. globosum]